MKGIMKKLSAVFAVVMLMGALAACGQNSTPADSKDTKGEMFPKFTAQDLNGNDVSQEIFKDHPATVINIWATYCSPCVGEMPTLEEMSKDLAKKDVAFIGICSDASSSPQTLAEAKKIAKDTGVTFTNLAMNSSKPVDDFLSSVVAVPTTIIVDRNGNIVGDRIFGAFNSQKAIDNLNKRVDEVIAKDSEK